MVYLTRRYRFSASHRLHNDVLTAEENSRFYGKCDNAFGHGHNYMLEVTVAGEVDASTGMVLDLAILDGAVQREVIDRFDLSNLNLDSDRFRTLVPTTENMCIRFIACFGTNSMGETNGPRRALTAFVWKRRIPMLSNTLARIGNLTRAGE